ncbi:MAG: hypothetical protein ABWZ82_06785 [Candidatus Limnocylindrales bacterium]
MAPRTRAAEPARLPPDDADPWPSLPALDDEPAMDAAGRPHDLERQVRLRAEQRRL